MARPPVPLPYAPADLPPEVPGGLEIAPLRRPRSVAEENGRRIDVLAETDPAAGSQIDAIFTNTRTDAPRLFEGLPGSMRSSVVATLAAACTSRRSNHPAHGPWPGVSTCSLAWNGGQGHDHVPMTTGCDPGGACQAAHSGLWAIR